MSLIATTSIPLDAPLEHTAQVVPPDPPEPVDPNP